MASQKVLNPVTSPSQSDAKPAAEKRGHSEDSGCDTKRSKPNSTPESPFEVVSIESSSSSAPVELQASSNNTPIVDRPQSTQHMILHKKPSANI